MLIYAVTEETRLYLLKAYESFHFNFMELVIEKDMIHNN